jgi:WD repeat-containing protein 61
MAWLSDSVLLTGSVDGTLKCWSVEKDAITGPKWAIEGEFQMGVVSICTLVEGSSFAATSMDGCVRVCNAEGKVLRKIEAGPVDCWSLAASRDGKEVVSGTYTGAVNVWEAQTGVLKRTVDTNGSFALAVARSDDLVAVGSKDGAVYQINLSTGEVHPSKAKVHHLPVRALCYSRDGTRLYTASDDGLATVLTAEAGEKVGVFKGHLSWVLGVACSDSYVATASADRRVRVWDPETKECLATFEAHTGQAFSVAFNPNGTYLASGGAGGELQLFAVANAG